MKHICSHCSINLMRLAGLGLWLQLTVASERSSYQLQITQLGFYGYLPDSAFSTTLFCLLSGAPHVRETQPLLLRRFTILGPCAVQWERRTDMTRPEAPRATLPTPVPATGTNGPRTGASLCKPRRCLTSLLVAHLNLGEVRKGRTV